jgi:curved DNA-binding protein CbpA
MSFFRDVTPHDILNLRPGASYEELRARYKYLVLRYHPDKISDKDAELVSPEYFMQIQEAYKEIMLQRKRAEKEIEYDPDTILKEVNIEQNKYTQEVLSYSNDSNLFLRKFNQMWHECKPKTTTEAQMEKTYPEFQPKDIDKFSQEVFQDDRTITDENFERRCNLEVPKSYAEIVSDLTTRRSFKHKKPKILLDKQGRFRKVRQKNNQNCTTIVNKPTTRSTPLQKQTQTQLIRQHTTLERVKPIQTPRLASGQMPLSYVDNKQNTFLGDRPEDLSITDLGESFTNTFLLKDTLDKEIERLKKKNLLKQLKKVAVSRETEFLLFQEEARKQQEYWAAQEGRTFVPQTTPYEEHPSTVPDDRTLEYFQQCDISFQTDANDPERIERTKNFRDQCSRNVLGNYYGHEEPKLLENQKQELKNLQQFAKKIERKLDTINDDV